MRAPLGIRMRSLVKQAFSRSSKDSRQGFFPLLSLLPNRSHFICSDDCSISEILTLSPFQAEKNYSIFPFMKKWEIIANK